jgi:hypothetical protein
MKFQTVILANGMDFSIYGPRTVRVNDLTTLQKSRILNHVEDLQTNEAVKYKVFGDSAYWDDDFIGTGGGRGMASVRESIEHTYKDMKTLWKYCDYKHVLKLRGQPVGKILFNCLLLRNAYVTLNGSQVNEYFVLLPPTLVDWTGQGPRAHPIPSNNIWSDNYEGDSDVDDEEFDDVDTDDENGEDL